MPNPLHTITQVFKDHFICDDKDIYIDTIRLIDFVASELDQFEYETNSEGEKILQELVESVDEYNKAQREDEDAEVVDEDEDEIERNTEDLDDDDSPTEEKVT